MHEIRLGSLELVPSSGGRFEVSVDGQLVFSKAALGRHAEPHEWISETRVAPWVIYVARASSSARTVSASALGVNGFAM